MKHAILPNMLNFELPLVPVYGRFDEPESINNDDTRKLRFVQGTNKQSGFQTHIFPDSESPSSSQALSLSQGSSWSQENKENKLDDLNTMVDMLSNGSVSPIKFRVTRDLEDLQPSTLRTLKRKASETVNLIVDRIAPGQGDKLLKLISEEENTGNSNDDYTEKS